ncbi:MAG: protein-glutamate methylesterase/protein-glutamine glutaminase [Acidobacteriota bacterium]
MADGRDPLRGAVTGANRKTRVLVVDDSAIVRRILTDALASQPDIEVVATAPDAYVARDKILALAPDVLTLDIEMPRMDGLTFLQKIMQHRPMPVIVISSLGQAGCEAAIKALASGAVDVLAKPGGPYSVGDLIALLPDRIRAAAAARVRRRTGCEEERAAPAKPPAPAERPGSPVSLIAIGASTGGTEAIEAVLREIDPASPGIVIVQHIPAGFSRAFAERLNRVCPIRVKEATDGDRVECGSALIAPGDFHMVVRRAGRSFRVTVEKGPPVCYQRPSVDVLFASAANAAAASAVGVILTGMGRDGAQGLLKMRQAGAFTIAQDEASSVVYGMPREAVIAGAVDRVLPLRKIALEIARVANSGDGVKTPLSA